MLRVPDQPPKTFTLPYVTPEFRILTWLGISGLNDGEAVDYGNECGSYPLYSYSKRWNWE